MHAADSTQRIAINLGISQSRILQEKHTVLISMFSLRIVFCLSLPKMQHKIGAESQDSLIMLKWTHKGMHIAAFDLCNIA